MTFIISKISPDEESNKVQMLKEEFYRTNPLVAIFDLHKDGDDEPTAPPPDLHSPQDFNIKAEDSKGQIIGLAINKSCIPKVNNPEPEEDNVIYKFLSFLEVDAKLDELPEKTMELSILVVGEEWRRQGVAKMLVEESMRVSRQAGFQAMRVCCSSEFTARIVRCLGWKMHYRLAYQDYPSRSGRSVLVKTHPIHKHIYYYWIEL